MILGHTWEWWLSQGAPGLGAIASLLLVLYYSRLYRETKEQTKATRASYAPSLDTKLEINDNILYFQAVNRGEGSAKNIVLDLEVTVNGKTTGYWADFQTTLRPGKGLSKNESSKIKLTPTVYSPDIEGELQAKALVEYLREFEGAYITVKLHYNDVLEQQEFEEPLENASFRIEGETLEEILPFPWHSPFWATGPDIGLLGPSHIDFRERLSLIWNEEKRLVKKRLKNIRNEQYSRRTYLGPAFCEEVYANSVDISRIED